MVKRIKFTGLSEHQFWCGDDRNTPALVISSGIESKASDGFAEMRCRNGDVVDFDRLGNAQQAIDQGVAVLVDDALAVVSAAKKQPEKPPAE